MPEFIVICRDKEDHFDLRAATRASHLDYFDKTGNHGVLAGPMLNDEEKPIGSVIIIEAENLEAAKDFAANDPYAKAGLFADSQVHPYKMVKGSLLNKS